MVLGDTLYDIAQKHSVSADNLALLNGVRPDEYLYVGQELMVPNKGVQFYMTIEGDTFNKVLGTLETDLSTFLSQNENIYLLPGQLLIIQDSSN